MSAVNGDEQENKIKTVIHQINKVKEIAKIKKKKIKIKNSSCILYIALLTY